MLDNLKICSWNLQNCTYKSFAKKQNKKNGKQSEIINVIKQHDLVALQEIRDSDCVVFFAKETGYNFWISEPICSTESSAHQTGKRKERYAFLWNENIKCVNEPVILNGNSAFVRPPAIGFFDFKSKFDFVIANIHIVWGTKNDRNIEMIKTKELLENLINHLVGEDNIIICGDFNNNMNTVLKQSKIPFECVIFDSTVVDSKSCYDNFVVSNKTVEKKRGGIIKNTTVSDHYPVYIELECEKDLDTLVIENQIKNIIM